MEGSHGVPAADHGAKDVEHEKGKDEDTPGNWLAVPFLETGWQ